VTEVVMVVVVMEDRGDAVVIRLADDAAWRVGHRRRRLDDIVRGGETPRGGRREGIGVVSSKMHLVSRSSTSSRGLARQGGVNPASCASSRCWTQHGDFGLVVIAVDEESFALALLVDVRGAGRRRRRPDAARMMMMVVVLVVVVSRRGVVMVAVILWFCSIRGIMSLR